MSPRSRAHHAILGALLCAALPGCRLGSNPSISPAARSPQGVEVSVDWRAGDLFGPLGGELLVIDERGIYVLEYGSVVLYPFGAPARIRSRSRPRTRVDVQRAAPGDARVAELAEYARHPFGLDPDQLQQLIDSTGRDSLIVRDGRSEARELAAFVRSVESGARRFESVDAAIAEGYRKLGPDFPGMGEHWIHPGLVIAGSLDPGRPPVIAYTEVQGGRRLVGFAYTRVLGPEEPPPAAPFPHHAWHDHTGGVDEESLLLSGPASMHAPGSGFRLAMVHVWTGVDNPDGVLAQNNWALPFLRAGLSAPDRNSSAAARALSLSTPTGVAFYEELLRDGVRLEGRDLAAATAAFEAAAVASRAWRERRAAASKVTGGDVEALERIWADLWRALDRTLSPESLEAMVVLGSP